MECKVEQNKAKCPCTYEPCSKKGICCEWIQYHFASGELPACLFPKDIEKTFDRSIERFIKVYEERGAWWQ